MAAACVVDAFASFMRRLDDAYRSRAADPPADFCERLEYWRSACGLPAALIVDITHYPSIDTSTASKKDLPSSGFVTFY